MKRSLGTFKKWNGNQCIYIYIFDFTGKLNVAATAELLWTNICISGVVLLFDEVYLQKCEECFGRESVGTDETGNVCKGMTPLMIIIDLTKNFPYVIHAVPENKIEAGWLMGELFKWIKCLY